MKKAIIHWKLFWILLASGIFGVIAILPYAYELQKGMLETLPLPISTLFLLSVAQRSVILGIFIFIGLILSKKVGLGLPLLERKLSGEKIEVNLKQYTSFSIGLGVIAGILIILGDLLFLSLGLQVEVEVIQPVWWKGLLASFYGGITEELQIRLFLMTLLAWLFSMIRKNQAINSKMWLAIFLSAILFGVGHLPAAASIVDLSSFMVTRIIVLNSIAGIIFGWLYWKKGLEAAIMAHFSADIVLHVLFPIIRSLM